ncbi:MAG TPA: PQQ-binding-like beta-propeller repeat protein, partial [Pyrinomonadaceae bacterium]|nr:PQQ-binding-like beta-propeller repeat protein [Pyrinomonadaceae bacterium]
GIAGTLYATDARNGHELWSYTSEQGITSAPTVAGALIHFGSAQGLIALDAQTGRPRWSFPTKSIITSAPTVKDGLIYFGGWDGTLYAVRCP